MALYKDTPVDNPLLLPSAVHFHDYYLHDATRVQKILDILLDPHRSLPETIQKYLPTIKSYLSATQSFEEFCKEVRQYDNSVLCGHVWTNTSISYRCRTCATNPCMSLCCDCFHAGNHHGHDANMFRSVGGGVCDCGDITVMNSNGFCKHHGSDRIPNEKIPSKFLQSNKDDQNPLGRIVRLGDSGVLGVREVNDISTSYLSTSVENSEINEADPLSCCQLHCKSNEQQQLSTKDESETIDTKFKHKPELTCARFYEEKINLMLEIFSDENVSNSITNQWRTGVIVNTCSHSMHLSCYEQYLKSHHKKITPNTDPHIEFKCPMCRQISNALIYIPPIETNSSSIETIADLLEKNTKPCITSEIAEWITNFIQKMYLMINKNYRTIDKQEKQPTDEIISLFLVSTLRFNLENDLLIRDIEQRSTRIINRKSCFRELFYICNLEYPHLLDQTHLTLWYRITGLAKAQLQNDIQHQMTNIGKQTVPMLLSDPIVLLLRIMLNLPYLVPIESYRMIVQALFNLTYIQALFSIVSEMNKIEQEMWCTTQINKLKNNMLKYLRMISCELLHANLHSDTEQSTIWTLESINTSIQERCGNFIKLAGLIQHHLYQPITWWSSGRSFAMDFLWKSLVEELQLSGNGEPYWFCQDSQLLINDWLDELFAIDKQKSITVLQIARTIPLFQPPRFIDLPECYSDLFRSCHYFRCPYCRELMIEPSLCLICGIVHPQNHSERKCCEQQTRFIKEHIMACSGGLNILIKINSTKTFIQRERHHAYWVSLYLDQHGEEDLHLRRGQILYLDKNRLHLLYSAWISSNLDQLIHRWSTNPFDF